MTNSFILFRSYIIFVLLFLVPGSLLITKQIYFLLETNISTYSLTNYFKKKQSIVLNDQSYISLLNFYVKRKKFFLSISLSELYLFICPSKRKLIYKSLGQCYQQNGLFYVSEYYYLLYLSISNDSLSVLSSLLEIYTHFDNYDKISFVKDQIAQLSSFNSFDGSQ
uniref:Ycf37 n=1 Tax=Corynecladia elata TaxID=3101723 RepID=A0AA51RGK2_9FLOR|nr:Ycf37 [Laurencia elata]WMP12587.1 Ycf37 [Laurencia elata]